MKKHDNLLYVVLGLLGLCVVFMIKMWKKMNAPKKLKSTVVIPPIEKMDVNGNTVAYDSPAKNSLAKMIANFKWF